MAVHSSTPGSGVWKEVGLAHLRKNPFDLIMFIYFVIHIPITILIDSQGVFPSRYYPSILRAQLSGYLKTTCDPIMGGADGVVPAWAWGMIGCEVLLQFPVFFVLAYALWYRKQWIRIPGLIYGVHVATTLIPILAHVNLAPFDPTCVSNVATVTQRLMLDAVYAPFFLLPLLFALKCAVLQQYFGSVSVLTGVRQLFANKYL